MLQPRFSQDKGAIKSEMKSRIENTHRNKSPMKYLTYSALFVILAFAYGCSQDPNVAEPVDELDNVVPEIKIQGSLYFLNRHVLSFDTTGEIGQINVSVGDNVSIGQELMKLDPTTQMTLEQAEKQARVNLDAAIEKLNLYEATQQNKIAVKKLALDTAITNYDQLIDDHAKKLADKEKLLATANSTLDSAKKDLSNFEHSQSSKIAKSEQAVKKAEQSVSAAKLKIEIAEDNLNASDIVKSQKIALAEKTQEAAVLTLQEAEDAMQTLKIGWLQTQAPFRKGSFDFDKVDRYQADIDVAQKALDKANADLANLMDDDEDLDKIDLANKLELAELDLETANNDLITANQDLKNITDGSETLTYQELLVAVRVASEQVEKYIRDINALGDQPSDIALAESQTTVDKLTAELEELLNDPYNSEYELNAASVKLAQQKLEDANQDKINSTLKSPSDSTVYSINADVDDLINENSIVMKLVEPQSLIFNGSLEGDYLDDIRIDQSVEVHIPKLSPKPFEGTIQNIKQDPITKRGIITFPVIVKIALNTNIVEDLENYHAFVVVKNTP